MNTLQKARTELVDLLKAGPHKYIRREGAKGNYRYIYKEGEKKSGAVAEEKKEENWQDMPRNLTELTDPQISRLIDYFSGLSLPELRKRQRINGSSIQRAHEQKKPEVLASLRVHEEILTRAVEHKEFSSPTSKIEAARAVRAVIARMQNGNHGQAEAQKALEPWQVNLLKADMRQ